MNKYLEKIAGLPITESNLHLVANGVVSRGMDFAQKASAGKIGNKELMKYLDSSRRLNRNLPEHLHDAFESHQLRAALGK